MIVSFTGHRPFKGGLTWSHQADGDKLAVDQVREWLYNHIVTHVIVGGALGFDTLAARAAHLNDVPFHLYVPFQGQESNWPEEAKQRYYTMSRHAEIINYVSQGSYSPGKMQIRNEAMVNDADVVVAWWDGSPGGTRNCITYAESVGKEVINLFNVDR